MARLPIAAFLPVLIGAACARAADPPPARPARAAPPRAPALPASPGLAADDVEVEVKGIQTEGTETPIVLLASVDGSFVVPIWIGPGEALAIALKLAGHELPRPLTHDLVRSLLEATDARLERVTVTEIAAGTFYARLSLTVGARRVEIDSRPSDAIAIALRTGSPIFVSRRVLGAAGVRRGGGPATSAGRIGLKVQPLTAPLVQLLGLADAAGILVADVEAGGPAARAGLRPGDLIESVGGTAAGSIEAFAAALSAGQGGVEIRYRRGQESHHTTVDRR